MREEPATPPVRTLFYFLPVIEEILEALADPAYGAYLEAKLSPLIEEKRRSLAG